MQTSSFIARKMVSSEQRSVNLPGDLFEESLNLCHRSFLPVIYIQDMVRIYSLCLMKKQKTTRPALLAMAFYVMCLEEGVPRTLRECASVMGVGEKDVADLLDKHFPEQEPISPQDLIPRFVAECGAPRQTGVKIQKWMTGVHLRHHAYSPATVAAGSILLYARQQKIKLRLNNLMKVSGVSSSGIYRFLKFWKGCDTQTRSIAFEHEHDEETVTFGLSLNK